MSRRHRDSTQAPPLIASPSAPDRPGDASGDTRWLEALARFAGAIAHDYNNLLTIIAGNLQLIDLRLDEPRLKPHVREAELACAMAARTTQRLMTFARQRKLEPLPTDVNAVISMLADVVARPLDDRVTTRLDLSPHLPRILVDRSELESALLNLVMNGFDAMPDGGTLSIATEVRKSGTAAAVVTITVADTGTGMPSDVLSRALEPFYTTKGTDRGSGLGLAIVDGFVRQSGGTVTLDSAPGKGTRVALSFPALAE